MKILILENYQYLIKSKDIPVIGREYILEDAESGTQAQNRAFHSLLQEYFRSGMHSYNADNIKHFKDLIKRHLGAGFESFIFVEMKKPVMGMDSLDRPIIKDAKNYEDIPEHIRKDEHMKEMIRGKLKSWSDYSLKERKKTIDNLIAEMHNAGVNTNKFMEILEGMQDER